MEMNKKILDYDVDSLFSTPIHILKLDDFDNIKNDLIDYAYKIKNKNIGRNASNKGGYQSEPFNINDSNDILHNLIMKIISNMTCFRENVSVECDAWININPPKSFNAKHCHPNCDMASVLWIKIPKNSGDIEFESPFNFLSYNEMDSYNQDFKKKTKCYHSYTYPPKEGVVILFPAHLQHKVHENKSSEDRISVSFNMSILNPYLMRSDGTLKKM
tara:strand:+ start:114 stop:761 length:648 start_codon:yes stop_codon:yes gene_type:complete